MKSVRMLAAGAVVLFASAFLTAPVRACDDRFIKKCEAEAEAAFVPEPQAAAPVARRKNSRVRAAAAAEKPEVRRAPRFTVRARPVPAPAAPAPPAPTLASDEERAVTLESPMSRRFRGFIDPQPMTVNSFEALRRPRLEAEHLAPAPALPANDMTAAAPPPDEVSAAAEAPPIVVTTKVAPTAQPAEPAQPVAEPPQRVAEAAPVATPAPVPAETAQPPGNDRPSGFPLHQLVLTLCGALGVASALRFIVRA